MKHMILTAAWFVAISCTLYGEPPVYGPELPVITPPVAKPAAPPPGPVHTEVDAIGWAFEALLRYPPERQPYIRFVYIPPWADAEWVGVMDFAVNAACGQGRVLYRGDRHAGGWVLAYDLARYATGPKLVELARVWDGLAAADPYCHVPEVNQVPHKCARCAGTGSVPYTNGEPGKCPVCDGGGVVAPVAGAALLAPHLSAALARHATDPEKSQRVDVLLAQMTTSTGGMYRADWLLEQLLTSVRGKYPEFRQINFTPPEGQTALQAHLARRGFNVEDSIKIGGEKGALLLHSQVTGKYRVVLSVYGRGTRTPLVVTYDVKDDRTKPAEHFIRNLVGFDAFSDAAELFVPMPNGLIEFVLADGAGAIQRVAPPDIVADHTKPDGFTKELEMGMSCVLCHHPENGYKTASNDMEFLLGSDVDFFGEVKHGDKTYTAAEVVDLVAGRFGERIDEPDGVLGRARRDYGRAVARLTDYTVVADGPTAINQLGDKIKEIYHGYRYRTVNAERVCLELGMRAAPGGARAALTAMVPPPVDGTAEDVLISLIRNGASVRRDDIEAIYGEMARRAVRETKNEPPVEMP